MDNIFSHYKKTWKHFGIDLFNQQFGGAPTCEGLEIHTRKNFIVKNAAS